MIWPFRLHRPESVAEAGRLLNELPDAAAYWGGTELLQVMKLGLARPAHLVDLKRLQPLRSIGRDENGWVEIGAGVTYRELERSPIVSRDQPELARLAGTVANPRVRNVGSIGGNLCFAEPHSDVAAYLLAADATVRLVTGGDERDLPIDAFVLDALETALQPGELLRSIRLPPQAPGTTIIHRRLAFVERPAVTVTCRLRWTDGVVAGARVVVGSLANRPALAPRAAALLEGVGAGDLATAAAATATALADEIRVEADGGSSADYRRHLATVLFVRALEASARGIDGR